MRSPARKNFKGSLTNGGIRDYWKTHMSELAKKGKSLERFSRVKGGPIFSVGKVVGGKKRLYMDCLGATY